MQRERKRRRARELRRGGNRGEGQAEASGRPGEAAQENAWKCIPGSKGAPRVKPRDGDADGKTESVESAGEEEPRSEQRGDGQREREREAIAEREIDGRRKEERQRTMEKAGRQRLRRGR